jgi:hypothetical protein
MLKYRQVIDDSISVWKDRDIGRDVIKDKVITEKRYANTEQHTLLKQAKPTFWRDVLMR